MPNGKALSDGGTLGGNSNPLIFRSVLPHEPLSEAGKGYIHLQGSFEPKRKPVQAEEGSPSPPPFWTKSILEKVLLSRLTCIDVGLPHRVEEVHILDKSAPFTKVRLVYESPLVARHVLWDWRRLELTAAQLLQDSADHMHPFACRALQVTQITATEVPPSEISWGHSSPPKFRRLIGRPGDDSTTLEQDRARTRFVFISNLVDPADPLASSWTDHHYVVDAIRSIVDEFDSSGTGIEVFVNHKKIGQYCHVGMRLAEDAQRLIRSLQDRRVSWQWTSLEGEVHKVASANLFLDYVSVTQRSKARLNGGDLPKGEPTRSECTSLTGGVVVPGLAIVPDFVTKAEEDALMAVLTGPHAPWAPSQSTPTEGGVVKRRVQHYGYVFDYETADVLRDRSKTGADCPPMSAVPEAVHNPSNLDEYVNENVGEGRGWEALGGILERTRQHDFADKLPDIADRTFPTLNQMTLNSYSPGDGIGSHVDTLSAFGDGLLSISLNSGIVMEFRLVGRQGEGFKKLVYLPPRSLLLMSGPARFSWEHMIVGRMTDTHNGVVIPRKLRVSLTLRTALDLTGSPLPRVESGTFPPVWGGSTGNTLSSSILTPDCERDHVHAVYDAIATQWHHTRGRRGVLWPGATEFLQRLPKGSVVADVGCGDGKYFLAIWEAGSYVIGSDISLPLLKTAIPTRQSSDNVPESRRVSEHRSHLNDRPAMAVADCMNVPLRSKSCDAAICIAVLHHLSTPGRRQRCIQELARIVRPGGTINIQAWAMDQEEGSRRKFAANDVFVPFNAQPKYLQLSVATESTDEKVEGAHDTCSSATGNSDAKSMAQVYSNAFNAEFDDRKGLVVFKRYCHLYRQGELEELAAQVPDVAVLSSGFESGNYFLILKVLE